MKQVTIKQVQKGDYFRFTPNGNLFVRGYYERSSKKYEYYAYDDVNHEGFAKGSRKVFVEEAVKHKPLSTEQLVNNARQLYDVMSYFPKEKREPESDYENVQAKKCNTWNYTFNSADLKSASLLVGYCKKAGLKWKPVQTGIMVNGITNKQINEARKKCNKVSKKFSIQL